MDSENQCTLVNGLFWGDEGKAKAIDVLDEGVNIVARYQGGANAGHTIYIDGEKFVFHQVPSGLLRENTIGAMGAGMVLDLPQLVDEINDINNRGFDTSGRIMVSPRAHVTTILHKQIEKIYEKSLGIGTTLKGIGPTYADKYSRSGLRLGDLMDYKNLKERVGQLIEFHKPLFVYNDAQLPTIAQIIDPLLESFSTVKDWVGDVSAIITDSMKLGKKVLIEGAQGAMLDIDWGTYPYVTSSSTCFSGVAHGLGIDPRLVDNVVGLAKAFTTRVGHGPFPTEIEGEMSERLRGTGENEWDEFGATTGRPRRCGWLDGFVLSMNCKRWGVNKLFLTKMDILDGMEKINICSAYKINGKILRVYPSTLEELEKVEPVYEELSGWENSRSAKTFDDLPENARYYIKRVEQLAGCPIGWVSTGPNRSETIIR